ncbi:protein jag [Natroniella sulfidigena]|uniref:RNA-binding cell elongation regulator Jag/EloR n=1 Tax=Natroniella sulfidigena TaxID=723921 RepID=UPI00200A8794|nr:RNA-binding cell elongation regulator Jag/EloR [Natroniella sulfidigena]MCK8816618.1 protein jag [Natroniella sulfidigena]
MERVIATGETVQQALTKGVEKLGVSKEDVNYEVLEESKSGFLGLFGKRDAKVEVVKKIDKAELAKEFLEEVIGQMELNLMVKVVEKDLNNRKIILDITGDELGIIIGYRGKTLNSLQYLTNLAINKGDSEYVRVVVDAEGYRQRRKKTLEKLAFRMTKKAKKKKRKVILDPMPAHERKIIHSALQNKSGVSTYSEGKEPYRKVAIVAD